MPSAWLWWSWSMRIRFMGGNSARFEASHVLSMNPVLTDAEMLGASSSGPNVLRLVKSVMLEVSTAPSNSEPAALEKRL